MSRETLDFNPFSTNVSRLYSLKTLENLRFSDVFRGYRSRTLVENGLIQYLYSDPLLLLLKNLFAKFRKLWVTVVMVYHIETFYFRDREIQFHELSTFEGYCQISAIETVPLTLDYW